MSTWTFIACIYPILLKSTSKIHSKPVPPTPSYVILRLSGTHQWSMTHKICWSDYQIWRFSRADKVNKLLVPAANPLFSVQNLQTYAKLDIWETASWSVVTIMDDSEDWSGEVGRKIRNSITEKVVCVSNRELVGTSEQCVCARVGGEIGKRLFLLWGTEHSDGMTHTFWRTKIPPFMSHI